LLLPEVCERESVKGDSPNKEAFGCRTRSGIQTKDRSVAVGALDLLVKTGNISEFEALSRIDEWKEKNDYW